MKAKHSKQTETKPNPFLATEAATHDKRPPEIDMHELIARRAYELYEQRGGAEGDDQHDWFLAEAEVRAALGAPAKDEVNEEMKGKKKAIKPRKQAKPSPRANILLA